MRSSLNRRLLLCGCLFVAGCGGEEEPPATTTAPVRKTNSTPVAPVVVEAAGSPTKNKPAATRPAATNANTPSAVESSLPPGVSPDDVFAVSSTDNTWEIAQTPLERNTFQVVARPPAGTTEPIFVRTDANAANSRTGQRVTNAYQPRNVRTSPNAAGLPEGFSPVPGSEVTETGLPLRIICDADGSEMALVPAGAFPRGTNKGPANTRPEHTVYVDSFYMSIHEVTLEQFEKFRAAQQEKDRSRIPEPKNAGENPKLPALGLMHRDVVTYVEWAKCSLPTESQWEKAARGTQGYMYPWGNERPVWSSARSTKDISPVMSHRTDVSPYGIFDLAGNAREWCADVYGDKNYLEAGENGEKVLRNPKGPRRLTSSLGTIRGNGPDWKAWHRESSPFGQPPSDLGFRCVLNLPTGDAETPTEGTTRPVAPTGF